MGDSQFDSPKKGSINFSFDNIQIMSSWVCDVIKKKKKLEILAISEII